MAKRKKINFGLMILFSFIFLIVGFGAGFAGRIYLFSNGYVIPETVSHSSTIVEGDLDQDSRIINSFFGIGKQIHWRLCAYQSRRCGGSCRRRQSC